MITALFIICIIQCLVISARLRLISYNRLDSFGMRIELMSWIMFLLLAYNRKELIQEPIVILFLIALCSSRIISGSSVILGHPHQNTTFTVYKGPIVKK